MATRLTLLRPAATSAIREGRFPAEADALDEGGRRKAAVYKLAGSPPHSVLVSPTLAAQQTVEALGLSFEFDPDLRDADAGLWAGRSLQDVEREAPALLAGWLTDPSVAPPDGESMADLADRIRRWLDRQTAVEGHVVAITHGAVIRAVLACALDLPLVSTLRMDIAPLGRVVLTHHNQWRLQALGTMASLDLAA